VEGIVIWDGEPKECNILPLRIKREPHITQFAPVTEVTREARNAKAEIFITESGRLNALRRLQFSKRRPGMLMRRDCGSNVTDDNPQHPEKTASPRVETEEGTVKDAK
jgi:hypothetical protein